MMVAIIMSHWAANDRLFGPVGGKPRGIQNNECHVVSGCTVLSAGVGSSHGDDGGNGDGHTGADDPRHGFRGDVRHAHYAVGHLHPAPTPRQHQTRELIKQATEKFQTQLEQATEKSRKLIKQETKKLTADFKEDTRVTQGKLDKVVTSLSDARKRLARIEGHLGIELPSTTEPESNGDNSEAA